MRRFIVVAIIAAGLTGTIAGPASAAKGGGTNSSTTTFSLVVLNSSDGQPHWGGQITFNVSTTATNRPYVQVACSQGGSVVYSASAGFFADYPWPNDRTMTLSSNSWTGGSADCKADLFYFARGGKTRTVSSLTFTAQA